MTLVERLDAFRTAGVLADVDVHLARLLLRLGGADEPEVALAAALVSHRVGAGSVCLDLREYAGRTVLPGIDEEAGEAGEPLVAPAFARWTAALRGSPVVGAPGEDRPLVLDDAGRLYLHRYWRYQQTLAEDLLRRAAAATTGIDDARLRDDLARLFPTRGDGLDRQRVAAAVAALRRLCVISGGPGTGKTTTVVRILALLVAHAAVPPRIALAAPTGKAAARMQEAIRAAKERLDLPAAIRDAIPDQARTIHRLLGARPGGASFAYHAARPLPVDALVVDEASMIDLALMAKLAAALPAEARLVMLGDRDQLASVEAGAVLGDVCGPAPGFSEAFRRRVERVTGVRLPAGAPSASPLRDVIVLLTESFRFRPDSGIGRLATAVNRGDGPAVRAVLDDPRVPEVAWQAVASVEAIGPALVAGYGPYLAAVRDGAPPAVVFAAFRRFRVLGAHRRGPWGVETMNRTVGEAVAAGPLGSREAEWYAGRPVLVTQNDYTLGLFNGDVGLTLPDADGRLRVCFEAAGGRIRRLSPARLPAHETTWAMTVHKSQGSEFDHVLLALPDVDSPLVTRELLYTAITRARERVEIWGDEVVLLAGVERRLERSSGLRAALW